MSFKIISGFLALIVVGLTASLAYAVHTGVAHTKSGGIVLLSSDPSGFWTLAAIRAAITAAFAWGTVKAWHAGRQHPNF
ncbi:hypothetical protein [Sphingomonas bacterium]|uniref:hypothetical protein n=1 Tax=Sphingomonas bacterium TaxID=1895847 RepID=UPI0015774969|nr:hypothetical protein [Sphingomonas bacterium]